LLRKEQLLELAQALVGPPSAIPAAGFEKLPIRGANVEITDETTVGGETESVFV